MPRFSSIKNIACLLNLQGEPSGCCEEQVESSLIRAASCGFGHQINDVRNNAELLKPDAKLSDRILQAEAVKCPIQKEDIGTSSAGVDESDVVKHPLESQPVDYDKVSNPAEIEVSAIPTHDIKIYIVLDLPFLDMALGGTIGIFKIQETIGKT